MGKSVTKADLVADAARSAGITKTAADKAVNAILESMQKGLIKGKRITLVGFGTFAINNRKAREGRNPQTKKAIQIPAAKVVKFKSGKDLKNAVNK